MGMIPTFGDVQAAGGRVAGVAHRTPVLRSRIVDQMVGALEEIHVVGRTPERGEHFRAELADHGLRSRVTNAEEACQDADIIVTATTARSPLFQAGWVRPGTHVASMGSDQRGKQELPTDLLMTARLFCDLPSQSVAIGEFQHVASHVADGTVTVTAIGDVLTGQTVGRRSPEDITVFDSSGIALQDLAVATALLDAHDGTSRHEGI